MANANPIHNSAGKKSRQSAVLREMDAKTKDPNLISSIYVDFLLNYENHPDAFNFIPKNPTPVKIHIYDMLNMPPNQTNSKLLFKFLANNSSKITMFKSQLETIIKDIFRLGTSTKCSGHFGKLNMEYMRKIFDMFNFNIISKGEIYPKFDIMMYILCHKHKTICKIGQPCSNANNFIDLYFPLICMMTQLFIEDAEVKSDKHKELIKSLIGEASSQIELDKLEVSNKQVEFETLTRRLNQLKEGLGILKSSSNGSKKYYELTPEDKSKILLPDVDFQAYVRERLAKLRTNNTTAQSGGNKKNTKKSTLKHSFTQNKSRQNTMKKRKLKHSFKVSKSRQNKMKRHKSKVDKMLA